MRWWRTWSIQTLYLSSTGTSSSTDCSALFFQFPLSEGRRQSQQWLQLEIEIEIEMATNTALTSWLDRNLRSWRRADRVSPPRTSPLWRTGQTPPPRWPRPDMPSLTQPSPSPVLRVRGQLWRHRDTDSWEPGHQRPWEILRDLLQLYFCLSGW